MKRYKSTTGWDCTLFPNGNSFLICKYRELFRREWHGETQERLFGSADRRGMIRLRERFGIFCQLYEISEWHRDKRDTRGDIRWKLYRIHRLSMIVTASDSCSSRWRKSCAGLHIVKANQLRRVSAPCQYAPPYTKVVIEFFNWKIRLSRTLPYLKMVL